MDLSAIEKKIEAMESRYESIYEDVINKISLDGRIITTALKEQAELQVTWELFTKNVSNLCDLIEHKCEVAYSEAIQREVKDSYRSTTITEAKEFAKADSDYKNLKVLLYRTRLVRDESKGILETINSRKYILNNLSNLVVAGMDNHIL